MLDRRIQVTFGEDLKRHDLSRVSDLRSHDFVVLLGEPGIGKSTVLAEEAAIDNSSVYTVRELMTGADPTPHSSLYIDALDEYRIDGAPLDKVDRFGKVLRDARPARWRLTCRAEDWRKGSDIPAIRSSTGGKPLLLLSS